MSEACLEPKLIDSSSICKLSDYIGDLRSGLSRRIESIDIGIPVLISGNIQDNRLDVSNLKYWFLNDPQGANVANYILEDGDILLCFINSVDQIGKLCIYNDIGRPAIYTTNLFRIKAKDNHDSKFLYYLLTSDLCQNWIKLITKPAVNQASFTKGDFLGIQVPYFHDKEIQQKIAKILSTVDNLIEKTQALIDKYTAIKQGMMADLFTRGIDMTSGDTQNSKGGKLRPSVEDAPELYKQTELGWVPKEWEVAYLGNCCEVHNNRRKPISAEEREKIKGDYPYYGCTKVLDYIDEYRLDGKYVIIGEDGDHFLKFARQEMTILIDGKFNVNNHAHVVAGTEKCLTEWFHFYFVHRDITYYLTRQGAGRFKLKKETLLELPMLLPPITEQKAIYIRYLAINEKQSKESTSLMKYQNFKKGLMQDLLTGKVRVN